MEQRAAGSESGSVSHALLSSETVRENPEPARSNLTYSTVTLLARFRGLSTSQPRRTAMW